MGLDESFAFSRAFGCAPEESVSARSASMDFLSRTNGGSRELRCSCVHIKIHLCSSKRRKSEAKRKADGRRGGK